MNSPSIAGNVYLSGVSDRLFFNEASRLRTPLACFDLYIKLLYLFDTLSLGLLSLICLILTYDNGNRGAMVS